MAIVGGLAAAGGAGYAANQERGVTGTADDAANQLNIQKAWLQANPLMQRDFNVTVYEGRTLLTGTTSSPELKAQAVQIATRGRIHTREGAELRVGADTICVHGDRADAAEFARRLSEALRAAGVQIGAPTQVRR